MTMKKKFLFASCAWLMCLSHAWADELIIDDVTVPQGGTAELTVGYSFTSTTDKVGFTFSIELPEGLQLLKDEDGAPVYTKDAASIDKLNIVCAGEGNFAGQPANASATIKGTEGTLFTLTLQAVTNLAIGTTYTVNVTKATFQERVESNVKDINLSDFSFTVTIGEPADTRLVLDENAAAIPASAKDVDIRVKRTIKANEWSTICLPFAMSEEQVKAAFGNDVELADFNDYEYDEENINVKFQDVTAIEANHPYIIKVSKVITEFTADGVNIDPQEAIVDFDTSRRKNQPRQMIGTYVANTTLDWGMLFLNSNKFWYSVGNTKMKAFRAYFNFIDLIPDFENNYESRITMSFGNETTSIKETSNLKSQTSNLYDLQGRKVQKPSKGLYIINGRKEVIK